MARRLDEQPAAVELREGLVPAPASSDSGLTPGSRRMLAAIADLPEEEREAFDLVRIQGLTQAEAGQVLGVSAATVNRRLNRGLQLLLEAAGRPPPVVRRDERMTDDPRLEQLLDELLNSQAHAGRGVPLLPRAAAPGPRPLAEDAPPPGRAWTRCSPLRRSGARPRRLFRQRARPCPRSPATRCRGCWAAAAWASSTGRGTCASTGPSP